MIKKFSRFKSGKKRKGENGKKTGRRLESKGGLVTSKTARQSNGSGANKRAPLERSDLSLTPTSNEKGLSFRRLDGLRGR